MFYIIYVNWMCMFCKSLEVTLYGWRGYKPSRNKQTSLPGSFYVLSSTSPNKDCKMSETVKRLWLAIRWIAFCPDITETVDWPLKTDYLPTYPYAKANGIIKLITIISIWLMRSSPKCCRAGCFEHHWMCKLHPAIYVYCIGVRLSFSSHPDNTDMISAVD